MSEQRTLASVVYDLKKKVTRRERFLGEMDAVIPWATLRALVEPHYTKAGRGRRPLPLNTMLRVYFLQQRDRNFNRGRSTIRRAYGAIADLASAG